MVGVNFVEHRFGAVAVFATLCLALCVNGEKSCGLIFEKGNAAYLDLECNQLQNAWKVKENEKVSETEPKTFLALEAGQEGCLRFKNPVVLNGTTKVTCRFFSEANNANNVAVRLLPTSGTCLDDECVGKVSGTPDIKPGHWATVEYTFPLKAPKECYVQFVFGKSKGNFLVDRIIVPTSGKCPNVKLEGESNEKKEINLALMDGDSTEGPSEGPAPPTTESNSEPSSLGQLSRNLMLTSASVITLNNLFN